MRKAFGLQIFISFHFRKAKDEETKNQKKINDQNESERTST